ncbi:pyridoxal phosphate-dependent aminotransferase [Paucibacter sp. KCTC 42545]|uniref:pyridoxal phosphate-dependent aminotransferase n=1 Tax=Paucibacter sp. KCTC 42545 TaxID=1768242 RepID=UPI000733BCA5|nr:aminotransferase class I/II-fold pyridoxal phosphate-dependent enzyme [Paucibacter sp. KCTC 42545]ALT76094.1 hypothetical protein AT984_01590 [Paucibacter sp. KCTC 42545]
MRLNEHGGSDAGPAVAHDFSSNASPLGPPPQLLAAVLGAERERYPDPAYTALRAQLGAATGVGPARVLPCSGGAEAIRRLSLAALLAGSRCVWVPQPGFGDYAAATLALNMNVRSYRSITELCQGLSDADLVWVCEPCNPSGSTLSNEDWQALSLALQATKASLAIDQAYEPLRLHGHSQLPADLAAQAWRLHCPNKALGLTGVRAAYLLAPAQADRLLAHAQAVAPSWVLSSEGCALLMHWHSEDTRRHLSEVRGVLRGWQAAQQQMLAELDWQQTPSCSNFWLARPSQALCLQRLRNNHNNGGIKLRDAQSFGLPDWVRLSVQPPESQAALRAALQEELKTQ